MHEVELAASGDLQHRPLGAIEIREVDHARRTSCHLPESMNREWMIVGAVESRLHVGVLPVRALQRLGPDHSVDRAARLRPRRGEAVLCDPTLGLGAQPIHERLGVRFAGLEPVENQGTIRGIADHDASALGGQAEDGGPVDVRHLEDGFARSAGLGDCFLERVEIHAHEMDPARVQLFEFGDMLSRAACEQTGMDFRNECHDAMTENRLKSRDRGHVRDRRQLSVAQNPGRSAGRDHVEAETLESSGEFHDTVFAGHRQQGIPTRLHDDSFRNEPTDLTTKPNCLDGQGASSRIAREKAN